MKELPELRALRPRADGVVAQVEAQLLQTGYLAQAAGEVLAACVASGRRERHANFRGKQNSRTTKHSGGFSDAPGLKMVILGGMRGLLWMQKLDNPKAQARLAPPTHALHDGPRQFGIGAPLTCSLDTESHACVECRRKAKGGRCSVPEVRREQKLS